MAEEKDRFLGASLAVPSLEAIMAGYGIKPQTERQLEADEHDRWKECNLNENTQKHDGSGSTGNNQEGC